MTISPFVFFFISLLSFILEAKINVKLILYRVLIITSSFEREQLVALLKLVCFILTYYLPFPQYLLLYFRIWRAALFQKRGKMEY